MLHFTKTICRTMLGFMVCFLFPGKSFASANGSTSATNEFQSKKQQEIILGMEKDGKWKNQRYEIGVIPENRNYLLSFKFSKLEEIETAQKHFGILFSSGKNYRAIYFMPSGLIRFHGKRSVIILSKRHFIWPKDATDLNSAKL